MIQSTGKALPIKLISLVHNIICRIHISANKPEKRVYSYDTTPILTKQDQFELLIIHHNNINCKLCKIGLL